MPSRFSSLSASPRLIWACTATIGFTLAICLTITVWGANVRGWLLTANTMKAPLISGFKQQPTPQTRGPVQLIRFIVHDVGIHPRKAKVNAGRVAIMIEDLSGGTDGLRIERLSGDERIPVGIVSLPARQKRGRTEFVLESGEYQVIDISRPANTTKLIVEP